MGQSCGSNLCLSPLGSQTMTTKTHRQQHNLHLYGSESGTVPVFVWLPRLLGKANIEGCSNLIDLQLLSDSSGLPAESSCEKG